MCAVLVDQNTHGFEKTYAKDLKKQAQLRELGIDTLRFSDVDVVNNTEGVVQTIQHWIKKHTP